jgi:hypothetical protein
VLLSADQAAIEYRVAGQEFGSPTAAGLHRGRRPARWR